MSEKGVVWLSICSSAPGKQGNETPDAAKKGISQFGWAASAYLVDEDGKVGKLYNAKTTPEMFMVDPKGTLIYAGAIDDKPTPDPSTVEGSNNLREGGAERGDERQARIRALDEALRLLGQVLKVDDKASGGDFDGLRVSGLPFRGQSR